MAVDLEDDPERIFDITNALGLLAGIVFADRHTPLAPGTHDLLD